MKYQLSIVILSIFFISTQNFANAIAKIEFEASDVFGLRVDAIIDDNENGIIIQYYRSDGRGDILQQNVEAGEKQASLFRLNPLSFYTFDAWDGDVQISSHEVKTGATYDPIMDEETFVRIQGEVPTFDMIVIDMKIDYHIFSFDKWGRLVWNCENCGPCNTQYVPDHSWLVQDRWPIRHLTKEAMSEEFIQFPEQGNIKKISLSGQTQLIVNTSEFDFNHEISVDPYDPKLVYSLCYGSVLDGEQAAAICRTNLDDGSYERIIDFGDWFNPTDDVANSIEWMHANCASVSESEREFVAGVKGMSSVFSFDYDTFQLKWQMAPEGSIDSDWTFPNPDDQFYAQHDAHMLPNGNLMVFDNGNYRPDEEGGQFSRGAEYELDYENMEVKLVWQFDCNAYSDCLGSCRRLENGNTMVYCADCFEEQGTVWEVDSTGMQRSNATWPVKDSFTGYRAYPVSSFNGEFVVGLNWAEDPETVLFGETKKHFMPNNN